MTRRSKEVLDYEVLEIVREFGLLLEKLNLGGYGLYSSEKITSYYG